MTLADDIRELAFNLRAIPGQLGLRTYRIYRIAKAFSGANFTGTEVSDSVELVEAGNQPPRVQFLDEEQLAVSGYEQGTVMVGPITPMIGASATGTALEDIQPTLAPDDVFRFRLVGPKFPNGEFYELKRIDTTSAIGWRLYLERTGG